VNSDSYDRKLAAILHADVAGYSRLMGIDEPGTLARLKAHRKELIEPSIASHRGRTVKLMGDGALVEFASVVEALACAVEVQRGMTERNNDEPAERRIEFRIGINLGDVIIEDDDIYGDGVNVAARLEGLADTGGVCISGTVYDAVGRKLPVEYEFMGEQEVKNIVEPVRAYRVLVGAEKVRSSSWKKTALELPDKPSIAVLPFTNMSGDPEQEYFSDGITEDITTALSKYRWFLVVARHTTFTYKGRALDIVEVGRQLAVRYILEGSVRKAANRVRVSAQLVEAANGNHLWAESYDRDLADIFAVQDEITQAIIGELTPQFLTAELQRSRRKHDTNLDAWDLVMRGREHLWRINKDDNLKAQQFFDAAIERAPDSGLGQSDLVQSYLWQLIFGWADDRAGTVERMAASSARAIAADPNDSYALAGAAIAKCFEDHASEGVELARKAVAINPNLALAHAALGFSLAFAPRNFEDQYGEAIESVERAIRQSPRDPMMGTMLGSLGIAYYLAGRYEDTKRTADRLIMEQPEMPTGYRQLAASLAQLGRIDEASAVVSRHILRLIPGHTATQSGQQLPFGSNEEARRHWVEGLVKGGLPE